MSYTSKNPRNESEILVDQGVTAIAATVAGTNRVINRSGKLWVQDSAGLESPLGSSSSAGVNYLSSQFAADLLGTVSTTAAGDTLASSTRSDPTKWATSTGTALITQSTNSSLRGTTNYLIAYTANAQYVESPLFTLDGSDLNKALLVQFDLSGVSTADDVQCYVVRYNTSNVLQERILVAGTASATTPFSAQLPTSTASFRGFFVSGSTSTDKYALRWLRNAANTSLRLDSFVVGPQSLGTGAAITDWQSVSMVSNGFGTTTLDSFLRRQVGDTVHFRGYFKAGTVSANIASINLPAGDVIDSSKFSSTTSVQLIGRACQIRTGGTGSDVLIEVMYDGATTNSVFFTFQSASNVFTKLNGSSLISNSDGFTFEFSVPLTRATSNVTMADRAVEEYASNSSTSDANDTTSFFNGISGSSLPGALTALRTKRIQFNSPILPTDILILEVSFDRVKFSEILMDDNGNSLISQQQNTNIYGMGIRQTAGLASNQTTIQFGTYAFASGALYGATGSAWSALTAGYYRVRKVSGGAAVGFPVSARNIVGDTSGTAVPTGYVGEVITASLSNVSITPTATAVTVGTMVLTAGTWAVYGKSMYASSGGALATLYRVSISTTAAAEHTPSIVSANAPAGNDFYVGASPRIITTTGQSVYLIGLGSFTGSANSTTAANSQFYAVRIA